MRPDHRLLADDHALDDHRPGAHERSVLHDHRPCAGRLQHAADPDAPGEMDVGTDLRARADRRPRVDHRVRPYPGADVDVTRHQHDSRREKRAVARRRRGDDPDAELLIAVLQRDLVVVLERADLTRLQLAEAEVLENRALGFLVHAPAAVDGLRDARLAAIESCDHLLDPLGGELGHNTRSRISAARSHSASVGTSASRQYPSPDGPKNVPGETIRPSSSSRVASSSELSPAGTSSQRYIVAALPATRTPLRDSAGRRTSRLRR